MSKQGAVTAFGPAAFAADLGLDEWELVSRLQAPGRRGVETRRLYEGVAGFVQQLRIAGLTTKEISLCWHLPTSKVEALCALDASTGPVDTDLSGVSDETGDASSDIGIISSDAPSRWPWPDSMDDATEVWRYCCLDAVASSQNLSGEAFQHLLFSRPRREPEVLRLREIRDAALVLLRTAGFRLDEIAQDYGVTRERVRQILSKRGGPTNAQITEARRQSAERLRQIDEDTAMKVVAEGEINNFRELAEALEWSEERVRAALPTRLRSLFANAKAHSAGSEWQRDDVVAILQAAAEIQEGEHEDGTLTGEQYDLVKDDLGGPSRATIAKMFGSWNEGLAAAGLHSRKGKPKRSKYTDERLWDYVVRYVSDPSVESVTFYGFDEWRTVHEPSSPSAQFVRNRLGPWSHLRAEAYRRAQATGPTVAGGGATDSPSDLSDYEYWAAEETLNRVRAGGANPGDSFDYDRYVIEGAPTASALRETFGSWGSALGALGWDPTEFVTRRVLVSDDVSITQLRDYVLASIEDAGQVPSSNDWEADRDKANTVGPWSYVRRFGSWRDALAAAGVPAERLPPRFNFYSHADLLQLLRAAIEASEDELTMEGWDAARAPNWASGGTYLRRYGSWAEATLLARELEPDQLDSLATLANEY